MFGRRDESGRCASTSTAYFARGHKTRPGALSFPEGGVVMARRDQRRQAQAARLLIIDGPGADEIAADELPVRGWGSPVESRGIEAARRAHTVGVALHDDRAMPGRCFVPELVTGEAYGCEVQAIFCANAKSCERPCPVGVHGIHMNGELVDLTHGAIFTDHGACAHRIRPLAQALLKDLRAAVAAIEKLVAHDDEEAIPTDALEACTAHSLEWTARTADGLANQCERVLQERTTAARSEAQHA